MTSVPGPQPFSVCGTQRRRCGYVAPCSAISLTRRAFGFLDQHHNFAVLCNLLNSMVNPGRVDCRGGGFHLAPTWLEPPQAPLARSGRTRLAVRPAAG